uniref:Ig-like domain-containing protein n=1 Tax=Pavo cristatus TaxID=9049 RepID=A0A8C9FKV6_PAVCR
MKGALAGPVVDPHVTAVWGKKVALKCIIDVNETITQVSWEKIHGKISETIAVHHPEYGISIQEKYQGRVSFKNYSLTDATIILKNVSFSDAGEYICKAVTFPLGNSHKYFYILTVFVGGMSYWPCFFKNLYFDCPDT